MYLYSYTYILCLRVCHSFDACSVSVLQHFNVSQLVCIQSLITLVGPAVECCHVY